MIDDIVARLRQPIAVDVHPVSLRAKTMREAADEIERLRADLDAYQKERDEEVVRLRAELAKERERADAHYRVLECVSSKRDELRADCAKLETAHGQNMREIDRLRDELAAERRLKIIYYDEWQDANKENGSLREALKPFAQWCDEMEIEGLILRDDARVASDITMADVRRVRTLLNNG